MRGELLPLDGFEEGSRFRLTQLLGRFALAAAVAAACHSPDRSLRISLVSRHVHVALPVIR